MGQVVNLVEDLPHVGRRILFITGAPYFFCARSHFSSVPVS
jgi:hypothetical protein